jgi:hypothetical protein
VPTGALGDSANRRCAKVTAGTASSFPSVAAILAAIVSIALLGTQGDCKARVTESLGSAEQPVSWTVRPEWAYVPRQLHWKRPPAKAVTGLLYSDDAEIVVFYPDGRYAEIGCVLYRSKGDRLLSISAGDDYGVRRGSWSRTGADIDTTSIRTYGPGIIRSTKSTSVTRTWRVVKSNADRSPGELKTGDAVYIPLRRIGNLAILGPMIADNNQDPAK